MSHTPGPWLNDNGNVIAGRRLVANTNGHQSSHNYEAVMDENRANGDLVAAAPELLESLQRIVEYCDGTRGPDGFEEDPFQTIMRHAKAAIWRAEGSQ